jgi:hypothetical protein
MEVLREKQSKICSKIEFQNKQASLTDVIDDLYKKY